VHCVGSPLLGRRVEVASAEGLGNFILIHSRVCVIARQTYEGGIGGEPGNEAHGGYTFCGAAALDLVGKLDALDLPALLRWAASRQCWVEGGYNGRTNKLADGCYSFWQGALAPLLQKAHAELLDPHHVSERA